MKFFTVIAAGLFAVALSADAYAKVGCGGRGSAKCFSSSTGQTKSASAPKAAAKKMKKSQ